MTSLGEALVAQLAERGVETVFGIPGVHTIELYRGLAGSGLRHVTPRHEQGAGFMADGYARVSGKPGAVFAITGPGLTNALTPMAQARADSVPMLVVTGANTRASQGKGLGHLHELPDQQALAATVALSSESVTSGDELTRALDRAIAPFFAGRPGPTHIEIPLDVAGAEVSIDSAPTSASDKNPPDQTLIELAARKLAGAKHPVILAGGGASRAGKPLRSLAEKLGAPVVQTVNARGLMPAHPLGVPASPSLKAVRDLIGAADRVLAVGTELGPTDYDMYATGTMPDMAGLIRIDYCGAQLARRPAEIALQGDARAVLQTLADRIDAVPGSHGPDRAAQVREAAWREIGPDYQQQVHILNAIRDAVPGAVMVGDSTQPIYAGNVYYDHDRAGGWFNAATGYGALGYGIPAAIGAAIADPSSPVLCITGDGGAQFTLPEIMVAVDENLPVTFVVWNNKGYREIAASMQRAKVTIVGCDPTPPDFQASAASFGIPYVRCAPEPLAVAEAVRDAVRAKAPTMVEITAPQYRAP